MTDTCSDDSPSSYQAISAGKWRNGRPCHGLHCGQQLSGYFCSILDSAHSPPRVARGAFRVRWSAYRRVSVHFENMARMTYRSVCWRISESVSMSACQSRCCQLFRVVANSASTQVPLSVSALIKRESCELRVK